MSLLLVCNQTGGNSVFFPFFSGHVYNYSIWVFLLLLSFIEERICKMEKGADLAPVRSIVDSQAEMRIIYLHTEHLKVHRRKLARQLEEEAKQVRTSNLLCFAISWLFMIQFIPIL